MKTLIFILLASTARASTLEVRIVDTNPKPRAPSPGPSVSKPTTSLLASSRALATTLLNFQTWSYKTSHALGPRTCQKTTLKP